MLPGPVFNAELITTARRARYYAIRFVYGMILLFFVVQAASEWEWRGRGSGLWGGGELSIAQLAQIGRGIFTTFTVLQSVAVLVLTPAIVAGVVADEKQRRTLTYLMVSCLTSAEIILGKLLARLLHVGVFLAIGFPVMSLVSLFGGVEPLLVLLVLATTISTACFLAAGAILVSTLARRPREANSQVYVLEVAWLFCPALVTWLLPMAGGRWLQAYEIIKPVNDVLRWSGPLYWLDANARYSPMATWLWMIGLQAGFALAFVLLAIVLLRPVARRDSVGAPRPGWQYAARGGLRFLPRPEIGDDAMFWKERYVSRTSGVVKIVGGLILLVVCAVLAYGTYQFAAPAFEELWKNGYGTTDTYTAREELNSYLRAICTVIFAVWCLGTASLASAAVVSEREEDTWTSLTATPLTGEEIVRAKMIGAVWGTRWIGMLLIAFWLIGLASGAVHPIGIVAVAVETAVFVWFVTALGVSISLSSKTSARAQTWTIGILLISNGVYLLCCIPLRPDAMIIAAGVTPMIEAISLLSYRDLGRLFADHMTTRDEADAMMTCVIGVLAYGAAALVLTVQSFVSFDAKIDRPRRAWDAPRPRHQKIPLEWKEDVL
jgi:ABC-type transport system involved in multi-copper enzyme maturation permease subunit